MMTNNHPVFEDIINYNYEQETFTKNIGNEARTFHISDKSRPLLSISRMLKAMVEHKYWVIPSMYLLPNKLIGQLSHRLVEQSFKEKRLVKLTGDWEQLKVWLGKDYDKFISLKTEKQTEIINQVNNIIYTLLQIFKEKEIVIKAAEKYICNDFYHGYIDLIGYIKGRPAIFELKTSSLTTPKYETNLQMGLYKHLINQVPELETYSIRFNTKTQKVNFEYVEPDDFKHLDYIYKNILNKGVTNGN